MADIQALIDTLGPRFAERAAAHDRSGEFVADNYADLQEHKVLSVAVPAELGGGGASYEQLCELLRALAGYCGSTALALSMHSHLIAANVFKFRKGKPAEKMLRKVAAEQLVVVSTGGTDWVDSNGTLTRTEGGFRVSGRKVFASGCPAAAMMATSAVYTPEQGEPEVLHFAIPLKSEGIRVEQDWDTHGMRGTGSNTLSLQDVFVPEEAIQVRRPRGQWHDAWSLATTVALPIFMSPYLGLAERSVELAMGTARSKAGLSHIQQLAGELETQLTQAQLIWRDMLRIVGDYDFKLDVEIANQQLVRKTLLTRACIDTVSKAMELAGGQGFYRPLGLERIWRDVQASPYHPLPERRQAGFTGRLRLGLNPAAES